MTAQIVEQLRYQEEDLPMFSNPLELYFVLGGNRPDFQSTSTALWRGYVGNWEIIDDRLYLVKLQGILGDGSEVELSNVFPGFSDRVFAHWFSGKIRIPRGRQVEYVHMGYGSQYEQDLFLEFKKGVLVNHELIDHGKSGEGPSADTYGPAAMTTF